MNYIHRMTLYLLLLFFIFIAIFATPGAGLSLPLLVGITALIAGLSVEYIMAPEKDSL